MKYLYGLVLMIIAVCGITCNRTKCVNQGKQMLWASEIYNQLKEIESVYTHQKAAERELSDFLSFKPIPGESELRDLEDYTRLHLTMKRDFYELWSLSISAWAWPTLPGYIKLEFDK